jgi:hypothetical protein
MPGFGSRTTAVTVTLVALLVTGCSTSGKGDKKESSTGVAASSVCDRTLDTSAAKAVVPLGVV